jgi:hypothetical protein
VILGRGLNAVVQLSKAFATFFLAFQAQLLQLVLQPPALVDEILHY